MADEASPQFQNMTSMDTSMAHDMSYSYMGGENITMANQSYNAGAKAANAANVKMERRRLRKIAKELLNKDSIDLELEEGTIFGVKSPAMQIQEEQTNAIDYVNKGLKIPKIDFEVRIEYPKRF